MVGLLIGNRRKVIKGRQNVSLWIISAYDVFPETQTQILISGRSPLCFPPSYYTRVGLTESLLADHRVAGITGFALAGFVDSLDPE